MQLFHWASAGAIMTCLATVQYKQSLPTDTDAEKKHVGDVMWLHKSFGLVVGGLFWPRLVTRIVSKKPVSTNLPLIKQLAKLNHWGMYGLVLTMVITGCGMGVCNGMGVPFFNLWHLPGAPKEEVNKEMAGYLFKVHKYAGVALEYGVAAHICGFLFHLTYGHNLLKQMSGPLGSLFMAAPWIACGLAVAYSTKPDKLPEFKNWWQPPPTTPVKKVE